MEANITKRIFFDKNDHGDKFVVKGDSVQLVPMEKLKSGVQKGRQLA